PQVVAIGGGVSRAGDLLLVPARRVAEQFVLPGVGEQTEIRLSRHGTQAGVFGAALLAKQELKRQEEEG
ncbi:MAG: ROK family protein, partial [Solirubrobacterales bacterium]|nr:ROK family protein [Solirubrobacterales bacterium]